MVNQINKYPFQIDISKYNIVCNIENAKFKIIRSNHDVFKKSFKKHFHSFYELHYITGGHGLLILDEQKFELKKGCVYLTGPRQNHTQITDPNNLMEEFHLSFDLELGKKHNEMFSVLSETKLWIGYDKYNILDNFLEIENELYYKRPGWILAVETLFSRIIITAIRNISPECVKNENTAVPGDRRLRLIDDAFIYSYKTITLSSLSVLLGLSERQVQRLIKSKYGINFSSMRHQIRMNAAVDMLDNEPDLSIKEISEKTGFETEFYFSKKFKEFFGISPAQYIKQIKEHK